MEYKTKSHPVKNSGIIFSQFSKNYSNFSPFSVGLHKILGDYLIKYEINGGLCSCHI